MFERYTERARRVLFFGRFEASQLGSPTIEAEHLLLGLLREGKGLASRLLGAVSFDEVREAILRVSGPRMVVSTSVEIPFSAETKRVLQSAAEEADRLLHDYVGTEHLLLGLLREEQAMPARLLAERGITLDGVRNRLVELLAEKSKASGHDALPAVPTMLSFGLTGPPGEQVDRLVAILRHMTTYLEHPAVTGGGDAAATSRVTRLADGLKAVIASMESDT